MIPALIIAVIAVVVLGFLVRELVLATRWGRDHLTRVEELELEVERTQAEAAESTRRADDLAAEAAALAAELAVAGRRKAVGEPPADGGETDDAAGEPPAADGGDGRGDSGDRGDVLLAPLGPLLLAARGTLDALWSLALLELERDRRDANAVSTASEQDQPINGLLPSLAEEISRVREGTGTPGTLQTSIESNPTSGVSVLLLRGVQAILAAIGRHCQAYDLTVYPVEGRLVAQIVCEGFDGPDAVARDATAVLAAVRRGGGDLALDRDEQGRLRAHLSIPTVVS